MSAIPGSTSVFPGQLLQFKAGSVPNGFTVATALAPFIQNEPQPWIALDYEIWSGNTPAWSAAAASGDSCYTLQSYPNDTSCYLNRYDRSTESCTYLGTYPQALFSGGETPSATVLPDGRLVAVGGSYSGGVSPWCYLYTPTSTTSGYWTRLWDLPVSSSMGALVTLSATTVMYVGGYQSQNSNVTLSSCYILDLAAGWTQVASLPTGLRNACAVPLSSGAKVWVAGGYSSQSGANVSQYQIYDVASNTWSASKAFPTTPAQICGPTDTGAWAVTNSRSITLYDTASDSVITTTHQFPFTTSLANSLICNSRLSDGSYCIPRTANNLFGVRYAPSPESQVVYVYATKD